MTAQPITGWGNDVSHNAMCQPNTGLESNAIPACNAVNTPHKEPTEAQSDRRAEGRDFSGSLA